MHGNPRCPGIAARCIGGLLMLALACTALAPERPSAVVARPNGAILLDAQTLASSVIAVATPQPASPPFGMITMQSVTRMAALVRPPVVETGPSFDSILATGARPARIAAPVTLPGNIALPLTPDAGTNAAIARAALLHLGERTRADGGPWEGYCEMFVHTVLAEAGVERVRYPTALSDAYSGPMFTGRAPAGSLVFFDGRYDYAGHVGIAMGDGTMVSALNGVVRTEYESSKSYLGWRPYQSRDRDAALALTERTASATTPNIPARLTTPR